MSDLFATSQPLGLIEPIDLVLDHVQNREMIALALTGILNPMGPTWNAIAFLRDDAYDFGYLLVASLNPFAQTRQLVARIELSLESICQIIPDLSKSEESVFACLPTIILPAALGEGQQQPFSDALCQLFKSIPPSEPLSKTVADYTKHLGNPWGRLPSFEDMMAHSKEQPVENGTPKEEEWEAWWAIMADQRHKAPEAQAILEAWKGAIQNFGSGLPHMPMNEAAAELTAMGFPFFNQAA